MTRNTVFLFAGLFFCTISRYGLTEKLTILSTSTLTKKSSSCLLVDWFEIGIKLVSSDTPPPTVCYERIGLMVRGRQDPALALFDASGVQNFKQKFICVLKTKDSV